MFLDFLWNCFMIKKEVVCTNLNCPDYFSIIKKPFEFYCPKSNRFVNVNYNYLYNVHNLNYCSSIDIHDRLLENIKILDFVLSDLSNVRGDYYYSHFLTNTKYYINLLNRNSYNIPQCIYINSFVGTFLDFMANKYFMHPDVLMHYIINLPLHLEVLGSPECSFNTSSLIPNCRVFLNSSMAHDEMGITIDAVKNSGYKFIKFDNMPFYNDNIIRSELHTHPINGINYNNCLMVGAGLFTIGAAVYLLYN